MIRIKVQTNGLNYNEDLELLGDSYYNLLEILITIFKYTLFMSVYTNRCFITIHFVL